MDTPRSKRALVVGIDRYPHLSTFSQLEGCVNDARLMANVLRDRFGFPEEHVALLTDEAATRAGILQAMDDLAAATEPDDIVVMFFAGHGSQITDLEGDEPDGLDETIVPHDTGRPGLTADDSANDRTAPNRDITDDEIHDWILRVSDTTPYVTLLFDCCHSGTIARDLFGAKARALDPDERPAEELLREREPFTPRHDTGMRGARGDAGPSGWLPLDKRYVLIAGCRDDERAYEYVDRESGAPHGAMTFFLARALANVRPGTTYRDVYEQVRPVVTAYRSEQHPQMEGALDRELFGVRDIEAMRFVRVEGRDGDTVTLGAGAAQGVTDGSEWAVYPPGTKSVEGETPLGRVRVTSVGAVASEAEFVAEAEAWSVEAGARAIEVKHGWSEVAFRIQLSIPDGHDDAEQALRHEIEQSGILELVDDENKAEARVYLLPTRDAAADGAPVPQLGAVETPTWAVIGEGRLLMRPHSVSHITAAVAAGSEAAARARQKGIEKTARMIQENFHKITHYRRALVLTNPDPMSELAGMLDVSLKVERNGQFVEAEPEEAGGEVVIEEGERIAFSITNLHSEPVYVYALDFGLTHRVNLLTMPGANEALAPGETLDVDALGARRPGAPKGIKLSFPKDFPFAHDPTDPAPVEGTETLKVFATTHPTDFTALQQDPTRSSEAPQGLNSLGRILRHTFQGTPMRDMDDGSDEEEGGDWTTVSRTFVLRKSDAGAVDLGATDGEATLGSVTIRTRGLDGQARVLPPPAFSARTRSAAPTSRALDAVLAEEHVAAQQTIEIQGARTRSLVAASPTIEVEVPDPGPETGQFVLYTDESGVTTWQFAEPAQRTRSLGPPMRRYVIDRAAPAPPPDGERTRGLISAVGKKLIKVLVFPLIDPIIGAVSETFAERWEAKKRPYGLRPFTPDDYTIPNAQQLGSDDWQRLGEGRALLFVHGTFSRAHSAFGGLSTDTLAEFHRRYNGRVFAFDHFTLSHDPRRNVEWFVRHLPDDARLDLDIVCHSRGGLVSRMLAEKQSAFSLGARSVRVGNVVFVASPNAGTHLADREHMGTLVDTYTNLLNFLPDNPVTDVLDGVVTVAKMIAVGALGGLKGLQAMQPGGDFQRWLNSPDGLTETTYYALGADYAPHQSGFRAWVKDKLMDAVFGAENDLVVPTASVYEENGAGPFPIEEHFVFPAAAGIPHTGFFQHHAAQEKLLAWLHV